MKDVIKLLLAAFVGYVIYKAWQKYNAVADGVQSAAKTVSGVASAVTGFGLVSSLADDVKAAGAAVADFFVPPDDTYVPPTTGDFYTDKFFSGVEDNSIFQPLSPDVAARASTNAFVVGASPSTGSYYADKFFAGN